MVDASLPYDEPGILPVLIHTSFLLLLNALAAALDRALYCGLLGQVLVGTAWGTPGAKLLAHGVQEAVVQLGYLGLLLLVYEGLSSFLLLHLHLHLHMHMHLRLYLHLYFQLPFYWSDSSMQYFHHSIW
jgi:hypothetical protein